MDLSELTRLVAQGEGLHLEFKIKLPEPAKLVREIVALANTQGGVLLLGVEDDGTILGVKDPHEGSEAIRLAIEKYAKPIPEFTLREVPISRKRSVIFVNIPESTHKPHRLLSPEKDGKPVTVIRIEDKSTTASAEMYHILRHEGDHRDVKVEYGEKESALMKYLAEAGSITLKKFMEVAKIPRFVASRTLVHLVRANVLAVEPGEQQDRYSVRSERKMENGIWST